MRILYVEDNMNDAELVQMTLKNSFPEAEIAIAADLSKARSLIDEESEFGLALIDLDLPDGSGFELLSEIRQKESKVPVIILTGHGDEKAATAAIKAGAEDYIIKNKDYLQQIAGIVEEVLRRNREEKERATELLRILYIEHNSADIDLTQRHLARYAPHMKLSVIHSASEMPGLLEGDCRLADQFDLLLVDYRLPGLTALEILKIIKLC